MLHAFPPSPPNSPEGKLPTHDNSTTSFPHLPLNPSDWQSSSKQIPSFQGPPSGNQIPAATLYQTSATNTAHTLYHCQPPETASFPKQPQSTPHSTLQHSRVKANPHHHLHTLPPTTPMQLAQSCTHSLFWSPQSKVSAVTHVASCILPLLLNFSSPAAWISLQGSLRSRHPLSLVWIPPSCIPPCWNLPALFPWVTPLGTNELLPLIDLLMCQFESHTHLTHLTHWLTGPTALLPSWQML